MRPHRPGRYLRARLPTNGRSTAVWGHALAEENPAYRNDRKIVLHNLGGLPSPIRFALPPDQIHLAASTADRKLEAQVGACSIRSRCACHRKTKAGPLLSTIPATR